MDNYGKLGKNQGDMSPKVEDYQRPESNYSQSGFSKTTDYIARKDAQQSKWAGKVKSNSYEGRYS